MMFPAVSDRPLQLVPNWNGITIPVTTPMPNATAKIRIQKFETWRYTAACGGEMQSFEQGDVGCGADGEGRQ